MDEVTREQEIARLQQQLAELQAATPLDDTQPRPQNGLSKDSVLVAISSAFPATKDGEVHQVHTVGPNFYVVEIAYTPTTGTRQEAQVLIYDNGDKCFLFKSL